MKRTDYNKGYDNGYQDARKLSLEQLDQKTIEVLELTDRVRSLEEILTVFREELDRVL